MRLQGKEIQTILILVLLAAAIPFLPNTTVDYWGLINPRKFLTLIILLSIMQFGAYIVMRIFGERMGAVFTGLIGGLVSSTIVYATLPSILATYKNHQNTVLSLSLFSVIAMLVEISIIISAASAKLLSMLIAPILVMAFFAVSIAIYFVLYQNRDDKGLIGDFHFSLYSIIKLAIFMAVILLIVAITKKYLGSHGILPVAFLTGLFEIHGISLATGLLVAQKQINLVDASLAMMLAFSASFVSKFILLWSLSPKQFAIKSSVALLVILLPGLITYFVFIY